MRIPPLGSTRPALVRPHLLFASLLAALLTLSTNASAQQSLADRLNPVISPLCGANGIPQDLSDAACEVAADDDEAAIQLSGNTAAAAGSNATQTTNAQVDAQVDRLATRRTAAPSANGIRSGSDGGATHRVGGFFNFFGGFGDTQLNGEEPGFDYEGGGFTSGIDVLLNDHLVVGGGFGWNRQKNDFDDGISVNNGSRIGGGDLSSDSFVFSAFGSWFNGPLYADAMVSYTYVEYESDRDVNVAGAGITATLESQSRAHQGGVTLGGGYQFVYQGLTIGPTGQMNYVFTKIEGYKENGSALALDYQDQDVESLTTSLGAEILYPISTSAGVFTPHFRMTWEHEILDDPRRINSVFVADTTGNGNLLTTQTAEPDRNFGRISVGASAQLKGGVSAFVDYETLIGLAHVEAHKFTGGARIEF